MEWDINGFNGWVEQNSLLFQNFDRLASRLTSYIVDDVLSCVDKAKNVASKFEDVMGKCDYISYNDPGTAEAYAILHFLDRYHRFQLIFQKVLELNHMPIRDMIDCLDVGTGPAPALYAVSDIYSLIRRYSAEHQIDEFVSLKLTNDYVESSDGFRNWIHHFSEHANSNNDGWIYEISISPRKFF